MSISPTALIRSVKDGNILFRINLLVLSRTSNLMHSPFSLLLFEYISKLKSERIEVPSLPSSSPMTKVDGLSINLGNVRMFSGELLRLTLISFASNYM